MKTTSNEIKQAFLNTITRGDLDKFKEMLKEYPDLKDCKDPQSTFPVLFTTYLELPSDFFSHLLENAEKYKEGIIALSNSSFSFGDSSIPNILEISNNDSLLENSEEYKEDIIDLSNHSLYIEDSLIRNIPERSNNDSLLENAEEYNEDIIDLSNHSLYIEDSLIRNIPERSNNEGIIDLSNSSVIADFSYLNNNPAGNILDIHNSSGELE
jgi:hypothetical protein